MSRRERKKQDVQSNRSVSDSGISKIYYIVIGLLFVILVGLIIFIFSRGGNDVNLDDNNTEAPVEDIEPDAPVEEDSDTDETEPEDEEPANTEEPADDTDADSDEDNTEEPADENENPDEAEEGNPDAVNSDAPHDPSHAVDYNSGSADRVAIKSQIMQATGLSSELTEWWIGNDGPGRVKATVSDSANTTYYDVYLQYGDGNWHVTSFQEVSGN